MLKSSRKYPEGIWLSRESMVKVCYKPSFLKNLENTAFYLKGWHPSEMAFTDARLTVGFLTSPEFSSV